MEINKIYQGDALEVLKTFPNESIDCCISSPPYWSLRDYKVECQLGLEPIFQEYLKKLLIIFDEIRRVLKKTGNCWVNLGDTYISKGATRHLKYGDPKNPKVGIKTYIEPSALPQSVLEKSLCLIPYQFAIGMIKRNWLCRNIIIWHKPNCMPSSVKDRFTVDFESVFFFTKSKKYWFEQQFENFESNDYDRRRMEKARTEYGGKWAQESGGSIKTQRAFVAGNSQGRNKRCVWTIPTRPFKEAHFAVYPEKLIEPMIKAGCPESGIVLDPFMGAGTTAVVAKKLGRYFIGIELKQEYIDIANKRLAKIPERLDKFNF